MLFGRSFQVTLVKPSKHGEEKTAINLDDLDYEKLGQIAKDTVKVAAISVVAVGAAFFVMGTAKQVIVNLTNPANYR